MSKGLTPRMRNQRTKNPIICIVCEAEKTEVIYFENLKQIAGRKNPINIKVFSKGWRKAIEFGCLW
jgi:hypothetical protein